MSGKVARVSMKFLLHSKYGKTNRLFFSGLLLFILWLVSGYYQAYINYDNVRVCACFVCNPRTCTELILQRLQSILAIQMTYRVALHIKTCWYCWILKTISLLMHYVFLFIYIVYTRIIKSWFYKKKLGHSVFVRMVIEYVRVLLSTWNQLF